jgi:hypothetical protein
MVRPAFLLFVLLAGIGLSPVPRLTAQGAEAGREPVGARIDPHAARTRLVVLTDIANEPDDQMSMVRLLVYSNQLDIEGLVATTSTWMKRTVRPDVIRLLIDAYEEVRPRLLEHQPGFPTAAALREVVTTGQPGYGMAAVGPGKASPGAQLIVRAADRDDPRPLWVTVWGGANTLAQALLDLRAQRTPEEVERFVSKLRVYSISDQDDAGPWIRREFPGLHYIAMPSPAGRRAVRLRDVVRHQRRPLLPQLPRADFITFSDAWVNANIRARGPLGKHYLYPCCIHEGDTPSFLGLIDNGLASAMSPAYGGWGGRYVWRQPYGETRPFWTQGGDSYPGRDSSRDTVRASTAPHSDRPRSGGGDGFRDFAARMDWTIKDVGEANHNPRVVVNGRPGGEPLVLDAEVGLPVVLDAAGTADPDGNRLTYAWFFYPEAGTGIPGQPVLVRRRPPAGAEAPGPGGIPSAPAGGPPEPPLRVAIENANSPRATVVPNAAGIAHVILAVEDDGSPSLTSYRRVILNMKPSP